eukprot:15458375-Alexandrium_andersonii.AAC.1
MVFEVEPGVRAFAKADMKSEARRLDVLCAVVVVVVVDAVGGSFRRPLRTGVGCFEQPFCYGADGPAATLPRNRRA